MLSLVMTRLVGGRGARRRVRIAFLRSPALPICFILNIYFGRHDQCLEGSAWVAPSNCAIKDLEFGNFMLVL
jgi:hypothetical protein